MTGDDDDDDRPDHPQVIPEVIPDVRCFHMFVVGMMLCARAASSQTPRQPVSDRALAQGSMGALADAGRIDASQLSQTFSSLPDKGSWFDRAADP